MKSKNTDIASSIFSNRECIAESTNIGNIFHDFFHSVAPAIQSKIKFSYKFLQRTMTLSPCIYI